MQSRHSASYLPARERGNVLVVSFLLVTMITALITAHLITVQKNSRQCNFINDLSEMRKFAESGVTQSLYELSFGVGKGDGNIGTDNWVLGCDLGRDAKASTKDDGCLLYTSPSPRDS